MPRFIDEDKLNGTLVSAYCSDETFLLNFKIYLPTENKEKIRFMNGEYFWAYHHTEDNDQQFYQHNNCIHWNILFQRREAGWFNTHFGEIEICLDLIKKHKNTFWPGNVTHKTFFSLYNFFSNKNKLTNINISSFLE